MIIPDTDLDFNPSRIPDLRVKKARIPDPDPNTVFYRIPIPTTQSKILG
jgi:hypothetical protein